MLRGQDIAEIKRMWKKEDVRCDRFAAAYVDADGGMQIQESKTLMNLDEVQMIRHIDLVKKMLTLDIDNKIVEGSFNAKFPDILVEARDSRLQDMETMEYLFEMIRNNISQPAPYEILAYHVVYDIPRKGTDGADQGESEDVYEYILCIVCNTKVTKRQLAVMDGKVSVTIPDRVIKNPVTGFIWPAFIERAADEDRIIIYNENAEHPEHDLYEKGWDVERFLTTEEIRRIFDSKAENKIKDLQKKEDVMIKITQELGKLAPEKEIDDDLFCEIQKAAGVNPEYSLMDVFERYLSKFRPKAIQMILPKYVKMNASEKKSDRLKRLLLEAAAIIEDTKGAESELARNLRTEADLR